MSPLPSEDGGDGSYRQCTRPDVLAEGVRAQPEMSAQNTYWPASIGSNVAERSARRSAARKWDFSRRNSSTLRRALPLPFERQDEAGKRASLLPMRRQ
jgi:hypothetical protein